MDRTFEKSTMKAIVYENYGPPEVLQLRDVSPPSCGDGQLLLRVRAVEATKSDTEMRRCKFSVKWFWLPIRIALGIRKPKRQILGFYFSGEVEAVGAHVRDFAVGDAVYGTTGFTFGAYGELVAVSAKNPIVAKPTNMTFEEAAALPLGAMNALHFLKLAKVQPGESVLINGAGGSIGAYGVQVAKSMGAVVTGVDAGYKEAYVREQGVDRFIDYTRDNFATDDARYDVVFDMVPSSDYSACIGLLKPGGRYLSGNPRVSVMLRSLFTSWFTDKTASFAFAPESKEVLLELKEMAERGHIRSIVGRVMGMEEAVEAHRLVETEERVGAVVLRIGDRRGC